MKRDRPEWFNSASEYVLEICFEASIPLTRPTIIGAVCLEYESPPSTTTIRTAIGDLEEHEFLEIERAGYDRIELYRLTDIGREWLRGADLEDIGR